MINVCGQAPLPLGAIVCKEGVHFSLYSEHADKVELCLFDTTSQTTPSHIISIRERWNNTWHTFVPGITTGQLYGYRVHGPRDPARGYRFNHYKLLLDPYAKAIAGTFEWNSAVFGYDINSPDKDLSFNTADSAPYVPRSVVVNDMFNWEDDIRPCIPMHQSIIYEAHVKGFTQSHPGIPPEIRGTYAAMAHPVSIAYLQSLGITTLELMPVHHFITEQQLAEKGFANYWGYNSIGFFAPHAGYSSGGMHGEQVTEFKQMVKALHRAGIEVILDVVYNHTAEGNQLGPLLCFKGIDNTAYYRLEKDRRFYTDYTGTGNTLNTMHSATLKLIMDSLRYWITEMHVDGFRFDLAAALIREPKAVNDQSAFLNTIQQDPLIAQVKLIAEPWDIPKNGYQLGRFPPIWSEWNGIYRDTMKAFWLKGKISVSSFTTSFTGSPHLYQNSHRCSSAGINFITAHDGFTLNDLVCYNKKQNKENCCEEGPSADPIIIQQRTQLKKNLLCTLFLSQGVPMLLSGDEISNTQQGNNNAYYQDNEMSWLNWQQADTAMLRFVQQLIRFRKQHPVFTSRHWLNHENMPDSAPALVWFRPDGKEITSLHRNKVNSLAVFINGTNDQQNDTPSGEHFYILFNNSRKKVIFTMPPEQYGSQWQEIINTANENSFAPGKTVKALASIHTESASMQLFCLMDANTNSKI